MTDQKSPKSLAEMTKEVDEVNRANGWTQHDRTFGDNMALLLTELGEAYDAFRHWGLEDATDYKDAVYTATNPALAKPEGVGSEFADILIRLLDSASQFGIDLEAEYTRKIAYNRTRGYRHGGKRI